MRRRIGLVSAVLVALTLPGCSDSDPPAAGVDDARRGPARGAPPPQAAPVALPRSPNGADYPTSTLVTTPTGAVPAAAPTDGGLPAGDGGAVPHDDHELAVAIEAQGRPLAACFDVSLASVPDVNIDFQISVSGRVTRTEVSGPGLDRAVSECVRRVAESVQFPGQGTSRAYRYPLHLRRVDAGAAAPR